MTPASSLFMPNPPCMADSPRGTVFCLLCNPRLGFKFRCGPVPWIISFNGPGSIFRYPRTFRSRKWALAHLDFGFLDTRAANLPSEYDDLCRHLDKSWVFYFQLFRTFPFLFPLFPPFSSMKTFNSLPSMNRHAQRTIATTLRTSGGQWALCPVATKLSRSIMPLGYNFSLDNTVEPWSGVST